MQGFNNVLRFEIAREDKSREYWDLLMKREIKPLSPVIQREEKRYEKKYVIYLTDPPLKQEKTCCFQKSERTEHSNKS